MFLIIGTRSETVPLATVGFVCHHCGIDSRHVVARHSTRLTVFFLPVARFGTRHEVQCGNCGARTSLTRRQAANAVEWAERRGS